MGERIADATEKLAALPGTFEKTERPVLSVVVAALVEAMSDHRSDERVMVGGTAEPGPLR